MFELSVSTTVDKQNYISELYKRLFYEVKRDSGIVIKQNYRGRSYFAIAINDNKKEYYKSKILDYIIFMIIDDYKFNYYKENLHTDNSGIVTQVFLKAISIFDADIDKEFIKNQIELSFEVLVDSLFFFKLQPLKNRWKKTAEIINQNQVLTSTSSMVEVMKYLSAISNNQVASTEIFLGKKQMKIKNYTFSKCFKRDNLGKSSFLTELIRLNPLKINLKIQRGSDENDELYALLNKIFDDKIYVIS